MCPSLSPDILEPMMTLRVVVATVVLVAMGCGGGSSPSGDDAAAGAAAALDVNAVLAAADRADGSEDRVVYRCAVCGLGMDGSPEITSTWQGYTFHHCSQHCREQFDRDPVKVLARLEVAPPGEAGAKASSH